jgi:hypothetical protein
MELKVTKYEIADDGVATVWLHRPRPGQFMERSHERRAPLDDAHQLIQQVADATCADDLSGWNRTCLEVCQMVRLPRILLHERLKYVPRL